MFFCAFDITRLYFISELIELVHFQASTCVCTANTWNNNNNTNNKMTAKKNIYNYNSGCLELVTPAIFNCLITKNTKLNSIFHILQLIDLKLQLLPN